MQIKLFTVGLGKINISSAEAANFLSFFSIYRTLANESKAAGCEKEASEKQGSWRGRAKRKGSAICCPACCLNVVCACVCVSLLLPVNKNKARSFFRKQATNDSA